MVGWWDGVGEGEGEEEEEEEEEISPVSIQRSSAGEVTATVDLGTGLRVTPEFGGGIREALQSF